jgi:PhzF family phenazine biosynthesis protein
VPENRPVRFQTLHSGVLTVTRAAGGLLEMDFPSCPPEPVAAPEGLAEILGVPISWTGRNVQRDLLVEVPDEESVRKLAPDLGALVRIDARCVTVTAPAGPGSEPDFVSRVFGPSVGVDEDPVTGSAHCMLAPYWTERFGRDALLGYQASERGGRVRTLVRGDRVTLSGHAVTVLDGTLRA